jgi:hypothetical protein
VFFLLDPYKYFKQADVFVQHNTIERDYNLWYQKSELETVITYDIFREQVMDVNGFDRYASFYLGSSSYRAHYIATSDKQTTIMARIGGILSLIYSVVEILARFYNRRKLLISFANLLYNYISNYPNKETDKSEDDLRKGIQLSRLLWFETPSIYGKFLAFCRGKFTFFGIAFIIYCDWFNCENNLFTLSTRFWRMKFKFRDHIKII